MRSFDHQKIEKKWQEKWEKDGIYTTPNSIEGKDNYYALVEYPYPSGNLHTGHWYAFAVPDMFARLKRMKGYNVLFPIGFDSFGLPAENAAIKNKVNPREWTNKNIETMTSQLKSMGAMFDWARKVVASDEDYYKWTQWLFLELYKKGLAYRKEAEVNWDPVDMTVLANEQVLPDGTAERSGAVVEKKKLEQWFLKITDYAEQLLDDLNDLSWPEQIKEAQRAWIGKSDGAEIDFSVTNSDKKIKVFTTRPDTLFGATYMVLAPEHELLEEMKDSIENWDEVLQYIEVAKKKSDLDRQKDEKEKTGIQLKGVQAINPATKENIPVFVADYVLSSYGTGAIMAVPAHDERDFAFAKKFDLPIKVTIVPKFEHKSDPIKKDKKTVFRNHVSCILKNPKDETFGVLKWTNGWKTFIGGGVEEGEDIKTAGLREIKEETGYYNVKFVKEVASCYGCGFAKHKDENRENYLRALVFELEDDEQESISEKEAELHNFVWLKEDEVGDFLNMETQNYLWDVYQNGFDIYSGNGTLTNSNEFDGLTSEEAKEKITKHVGGQMKTTYRLRDWLVSRQRYWGCPIPIVYDPEGNAHPVPEEHLPWTLPEDVDFTPTGKAPLATSKELKERTEKIFGVGWTPEVDTFDTFVDSSWYFLRYTDPTNTERFAGNDTLKDWMPVDRYSGGAEHTTMHVLYSRFFHKALFDLGLVHENEPYKERFNRGLILGTDGQKMSKRWGNVVDPDEIVANVGADSVRLYLGFIGPYLVSGAYPWDMGGVVGMRRFLERVHTLADKVSEDTVSDEKVTRELHKTIKKVAEDIEGYKFNTAISQMMILMNTAEKDPMNKDDFATFLKVLAPFAPHLTEELWEKLGNTTSIHLESWPSYDGAKLETDSVLIAVQINGKTRGTIEVSKEASEEEIKEKAYADPTMSKWITGKDVERVVYVKGKILSIVVRS